jgi:hypothetical protein
VRSAPPASVTSTGQGCSAHVGRGCARPFKSSRARWMSLGLLRPDPRPSTQRPRAGRRLAESLQHPLVIHVPAPIRRRLVASQLSSCTPNKRTARSSVHVSSTRSRTFGDLSRMNSRLPACIPLRPPPRVKMRRLLDNYLPFMYHDCSAFHVSAFTMIVSHRFIYL